MDQVLWDKWDFTILGTRVTHCSPRWMSLVRPPETSSMLWIVCPFVRACLLPRCRSAQPSSLGLSVSHDGLSWPPHHSAARGQGSPGGLVYDRPSGQTLYSLCLIRSVPIWDLLDSFYFCRIFSCESSPGVRGIFAWFLFLHTFSLNLQSWSHFCGWQDT